MSDSRIEELRQLCANPSDGLTGGDWCQAANEAVEIILDLEEQLEALEISRDSWRSDAEVFQDERDALKEQLEALRNALEYLLDFSERSRGGAPHHSEEWYAARDAARIALKASNPASEREAS